MIIAAHRGISSLAPENTLAAFKKAAEFGCEWIELDVQLSKDLIPVIIHDQTVERCTNGTGTVAEMTLKELKSLDAGSWFNEAFCKETIPTLEEVLRFTKYHKMKVNIELKLFPEYDIPLLCEKVAQVITDLNIEPSQILFSSFEYQAVKSIQTLLPDFPRGQLWEEIPDNAIEILESIDAYSAHCNYRYLTKEKAELIKQHGYQLNCYTPNIPKEIRSHWEWGMDMIFSDQPQVYFCQ